jgi:enamine deaminase RidA (YjgF/YER057c/UK114 family)
MSIKHYDINEEYAYSGLVEAGDTVYCSFCVGNVGESVERQIQGAFDHMVNRLQLVDLTLDNVVKIDVLFRDVWHIPLLEKVIKERFKIPPARKTISTDFAHVGGLNGLEVQIDCIAYKGK